MRLFIAVNISEENKNKIVQIQSELKRSSADIKWVQKENLHLTLKFLGEVADNKAVQVIEELKNVVSGQNFEKILKKFVINFEKTGVFPGESFPRVLWLGIEQGQEELKNIAEKIEIAFEGIGFKKEKRPFSAHLTIGRFRSPTCSPRIHSGVSEANKKIFDMIKKMSAEGFPDTVESISLIKSTLTPGGPVYEIVEKFQLEGK